MMDRDLAGAVAPACGEGLEIVSNRPVAGGSICRAFRVELSDGSSRFVKVHEGAPSDLFECEVAGLAALAGVGVIRVPRGAIAGRAEGRRFLVMEAIAIGRPREGFFVDFGRRLARLHQASRQVRSGFHHDNYIGATPQPNGWCDDWIEFFRERRLRFQLALARRRGLADAELVRLGDRLLAELDQRLAAGDEPACLLHGDLWGGNYLVAEDGGPVLIDPACYYGQREADLAMTRLFGGFDPDFYDAYEEIWPLPSGSRERLEIYKLYHLLNHLNLFGGSYHGQCLSLLKSLL